MVFSCDREGCHFRCNRLGPLTMHRRYCKFGRREVVEDVSCNVDITHQVESEGEGDEVKMDSTAVDSGVVDCNDEKMALYLEPTDGLLENDTGLEDTHAVEREAGDDNNEDNHDGKRDIERTIETLAINLCLLEKKPGKKTIDEIIDTIRRDDFNKEEFVKRVKNFSDCKKICHSILQKSLAQFEFEEKVVYSSDRKFSSKIYVRNAVDVLMKQVEESDESDFHLHPKTTKNDDGQRCYHHMLETEYAKNLKDVLCNRIMSDANLDVMWMSGGDSDRESFIGFIQLYSDKSKTSLKRTGVCAYPVHLNFMNSTFEGWKKQIISSRTLVAYLPVGIDNEEDIWKMSDISNSKTSVPRIKKLELLHNAFETILSPLNDVCQSGFPCKDAVGRQLQCHPILAEIAADMPEVKDLACLNHGCQTRKPCCRCECEKNAMNDGFQYHPRSREEMIERKKCAIQLDMQIMRSGGAKKSKRACELKNRRDRVLKELSIVECRSFLENSPLLLNNSEHHMYQIFGFEGMHVLDLGISKEMKKCIFRMLSSDVLKIKGPERKGRTYKTCRTAILRCCNEMLKRIQEESYVQGLNVDFSSGDSCNALNGLFTRDGICGMLEAKNYRQVDQVFPFIAAFIDRVVGDWQSVTTGLCLSYTEITKWVLERPSRKPWTDSEVMKLEETLYRFQRHVVNHFGRHQLSNFCTEKFHVLTHLADDIRRYGDARMLYVGLYENRHLMFKDGYQKTSRRQSTALAEGVRKVGEHMALAESSRNCENTEDNEKTGVLQAGMAKIRGGEKVSLVEFRSLLHHVRDRMATHEDEIPLNVVDDCRGLYKDNVISIFLQTGDQGGHSLLTLLRSRVHGEVLSSCEGSIFVVNSGIIDRGGHTCMAEGIEKGRKITCLFQSKITKQRVVASTKYSHGGKRRFSFVIVRGATLEGESCYLVTQVRALFYCRRNGELRAMAFVKYMDVVPPMDNTEKMLGSVCLRWSTDDDVDYTTMKVPVDERNPPAPWFDIVDFSSIVSVVQVVRQRYSLQDDTTRRHWATHRFCVNQHITVGEDVGE